MLLPTNILISHLIGSCLICTAHCCWLRSVVRLRIQSFIGALVQLNSMANTFHQQKLQQLITRSIRGCWRRRRRGRKRIWWIGGKGKSVSSADRIPIHSNDQKQSTHGPWKLEMQIKWRRDVEDLIFWSPNWWLSMFVHRSFNIKSTEDQMRLRLANEHIFHK